jgi:hypothetical protein
VTGQADRWIKWTTTGCVALLALIAATVSYLHMHMLVELHGQPGWVAALTPFSVDGMIVAASTTLLADSRPGGRGAVQPWALLIVGSVASLAANVAVAEPTPTGRVIAAWPSFALIGAYELLMRQVRRSAADSGKPQQTKPRPQISRREAADATVPRPRRRSSGLSWRGAEASRHGGAGRICSGRRGTGRWPTGRVTAPFRADARSSGSTVGHERWGCLVKRSGAAGEFAPLPPSSPGEPGLRLVEERFLRP